MNLEFLVLDAIERCEMVVSEYEMVNNERIDSIVTNYKPHTYGVRGETNKFYKWAIQLNSVYHALSSGKTLSSKDGERLKTKLYKVIQLCDDAMHDTSNENYFSFF